MPGVARAVAINGTCVVVIVVDFGQNGQVRDFSQKNQDQEISTLNKPFPCLKFGVGDNDHRTEHTTPHQSTPGHEVTRKFYIRHELSPEVVDECRRSKG